MKVIIPAAGIGTRLRPHTYKFPKAMLEVAGMPIIGHIIENVKKFSPDEIIIIVGYKKELLIEWVSENYSDENIKFVEQKEMKGLGHAVYMAKNLVDNDDELFIILGDTIVDIDTKKFVSSDYSTLAVKHVDNPKRFGIAETKDGFIVNLVEKPDKPKSNLALLGVYYIKDAKLLFDAIEYIMDNNITTKNEYQITDALNYMIQNGYKMAVSTVEHWFDCGTYETLLETNKFLLEKSGGNARSTNGNVIIPPVYIGKNCNIQDSIIGPYVSIGDDVTLIGISVTNSIIYKKAKIEYIHLKDSIVGTNATVKGHIKKINIGSNTDVEF